MAAPRFSILFETKMILFSFSAQWKMFQISSKLTLDKKLKQSNSKIKKN